MGRKQENYSKWQEKTRKDVEQGFGVLQSKFNILCQKIEYWLVKDIVHMVDCCLILHNWMVTICINCQESESTDWYNVVGNGIKQNNGDGHEENNVRGGGIVGDGWEQNNVGGSGIVGDGQGPS
jgi:hypothetical protein